MLHDFTIENKKHEIAVHSVFNDKLLISSGNTLIIVSNEGGSYVSTPLDNAHRPLDAVLTPCGNIVYTTASIWPNEAVTLSTGGLVINSKLINGLLRLSVSYDNIIYLAGDEAGLHQSTDEGKNWHFVFKSPNEWLFVQAIKVKTDHGDDYWINESSGKSNTNNQLRVYSLKTNHLGSDVTWRGINVVTTVDKHVTLSGNCSLTYDGKETIFLTDSDNKEVHVFSVSGQYCQILSPPHFISEPKKLAVNKERQLLYVGQNNGPVRVGVYKLT